MTHIRSRHVLAGLVALILHAAVAAATLSLAPALGEIGTEVTALAEGLAPGEEVRLVWHDGAPFWRIEEGAFLGYEVAATETQLATGRADADGRARLTFTVPDGFGFLHDVTLEGGEERLARQGFFVKPTVTVTPASGPPGTRIQVVMRGLGFKTYELPFQLLYDNAHVGMVTAISTGGTAAFEITATGAPGEHVLQIMRGAFSAPYLNGQQAPTHLPPLDEPFTATFRVTEGEAVRPAPLAEQGLAREPGSPQATATTGPRIWTDRASGRVGEPVTLLGEGLPPSTSLELRWTTVVGNRIGGQGWQESERVLATVRSEDDGTLRHTLATPDDLGGAHALAVANGDATLATTSYRIDPGLAAFGTVDDPEAGAGGVLTVRPGATLRLQVKGIGWTETENITTVVHDNTYTGYACGFNSQGDVTLLLPASPQPGWHFLDLYPAIYKGDMGQVRADPFRIPMLNAADHPGDEIPVLRVAYLVLGEEAAAR